MRTLIALLLMLTITCLFACKQSQEPGPQLGTDNTNNAVPTTPVERKLVWSDEFDYTGLPDSKKWSYDVGGNGWGNRESQYYTNARLENARVENGKLIIEARRERYLGNDYTSARLVTKGKGDWTYGRIEVRAKIPRGVGTWAAAWMLASTNPMRWPDDGEIDIMEHVGFDPDVIHGTVHTKLYNGMLGTQRGNKIRINGAQEGFHNYIIDWTINGIDFYVDDRKYFTYANINSNKDTYPFMTNFHLLLNIAIGGAWGGQRGIDDTIFPQKMEIEYVRVYQ